MRARDLFESATIDSENVAAAFKRVLEDVSDNGWTVGEIHTRSDGLKFSTEVSGADVHPTRLNVAIFDRNRLLVTASAIGGNDFAWAEGPFELGAVVNVVLSKAFLISEIGAHLVASGFVRTGHGMVNSNNVTVLFRGYDPWNEGRLPGSHVLMLLWGPWDPGVERSIVVTSAEEAMAAVRRFVGEMA